MPAERLRTSGRLGGRVVRDALRTRGRRFGLRDLLIGRRRETLRFRVVRLDKLLVLLGFARTGVLRRMQDFSSDFIMLGELY